MEYSIQEYREGMMEIVNSPAVKDNPLFQSYTQEELAQMVENDIKFRLTPFRNGSSNWNDMWKSNGGMFTSVRHLLYYQSDPLSIRDMERDFGKNVQRKHVLHPGYGTVGGNV